MNTTSEIETARRQIVEAARGMIGGDLSFLEGARQICRLRTTARLADFDPDIVPFVGIVSETDALPVGDERQHWSSEALTQLQTEIDRAEKWARNFGFASCQRLIERLTLSLRPYTPADEDAAIERWRRTWAQHYPHIDFNARVAWWRERWRQELVPVAQVVVAETDGALVGFVTIDPKTHYLDQIVVAPEHWGSGIALALLDEAKRLSPDGLELLVNKDNARAISFYEKHGFVYTGEDKNPVSGKPVNKMRWGSASAL